MAHVFRPLVLVCVRISLRNGFIVPADSCELHLALKHKAQDR